MAKVLGAVAGVALIFTGVGAVAGAALFGTSVAAAAATISVFGVSLATVSTIGLVAGLAASVIGQIEGKGGGALTSTTADRLYASIDPSAYRKMAFGRTALATDVRYQCFTGGDKQFYHQVVAVAAHRVEAIEELWLDQELVWSAASGVATKFSGYLTVAVRLEGTAANAIDVDGVWNAANGCRLTGCAYLHLRYLRTGLTKKEESPFASSITNRMTVVGKGCAVYDPRRDSTVGGSGPMRADDQSTWAYAVGGDEIGRNTALQLLTYLLGWRINGKLSCGVGVLPSRLALARWMTAANACDESVTLAAGGTEPRYRTDGLASEGDARGAVFDLFKTSANAALRDAGGRIAFDVLVNDLATPTFHLTTDDVLGPFTWQQTANLTEDRNVGRGRYTDPRSSALFQLVDFPPVRLASPDGTERTLTLDLPFVQSAGQAQRLVKQQLQRLRVLGRWQGTVNAKGWGVQLGRVGTFDFLPLGFQGKLFRATEVGIDPSGVVPLTLQEESPLIYQWTAEDVAPVTLPAPTTYDWQKDPIRSGIGAAATTADWGGVTGAGRPETDADITRSIKGPLAATVVFAFDGQNKELPRDFAFKLIGSNGTDYTASASWAHSVKSGSATATIGAATGVLNLTALPTDAVLEVTATLAGRSFAAQLSLHRGLEAMPSAGGSTSESTSTIASTNSTTLVNATSVIRVKTGAAGTLNFAFPASFRIAPPETGTADAAGLWRWRTVGGTFADVAAEVASSTSAERVGGAEPTSSPGSLSVAHAALTGLAANTDHEVQLRLRSPSGATLNFTGTATVTGS